jgi:hypothetical protein
VDVEVRLERSSTEAERQAVRTIFEVTSISANVTNEMSSELSPVILMPWFIDIWMPLGTFLSAVAAGAGTAAGKDAWKALKRFVKRLYDSRKSSQAPQGPGVRIQDKSAEIPLPPDLPDEAYQRLYEIENLPTGAVGPPRRRVEWDSDLQAWAEPLDPSRPLWRGSSPLAGRWVQPKLEVREPS